MLNICRSMIELLGIFILASLERGILWDKLVCPMIFSEFFIDVGSFGQLLDPVPGKEDFLK